MRWMRVLAGVVGVFAIVAIGIVVFVATLDLNAYKTDARDYERVNEWIDRIGWKRFFEITELPFTKYHIDNWRGARNTLNASAHIHF